MESGLRKAGKGVGGSTVLKVLALLSACVGTTACAEETLNSDDDFHCAAAFITMERNSEVNNASQMDRDLTEIVKNHFLSRIPTDSMDKASEVAQLIDSDLQAVPRVAQECLQRALKDEGLDIEF